MATQKPASKKPAAKAEPKKSIAKPKVDKPAEQELAPGVELDPVTGEPWRATVNGADVFGDQAKEIVLRGRAVDDAVQALDVAPADGEPTTLGNVDEKGAPVDQGSVEVETNDAGQVKGTEPVKQDRRRKSAPEVIPVAAADQLDRSQLGGLGGVTIAPGTPDGIPPALQQRIDNAKGA
jgi:hypothetical protein